MYCPKCQAPLPEPIPRFCNNCGMDLAPLQAMAQAEGLWAHALSVGMRRKLLAEGTMSVSEIADATGWGSLSYFSKSYKRRFGHNPKKK